MQSYKPRKSSPKKAESKTEERVYFDTKYGPVSIHQNGGLAKELSISQGDASASPGLSTIGNVRVSLHLERFAGVDPFFQEIECVASIPECDVQVRHQVTCNMKAGQTHGASAFQSTYVGVDMKGLSNTVMEFEFFQGETSLMKVALPLKIPFEATAEE